MGSKVSVESPKSERNMRRISYENFNEYEKKPDTMSIANDTAEQSPIHSESLEIESREKLHEMLQNNENQWYSKYVQVEESYDVNKQLNVETFNNLCKSLTDYLMKRNSERLGERLRDQVLHCYSNSSSETLKCSVHVNKFSNWLNETRREIAQEKGKSSITENNIEIMNHNYE